MDALIQKSNLKVSQTDLRFTRYLYNQLPWTQRMIGLFGARGTGKTTILLQYIKAHYGYNPKALYVSLDDLYFSENSLYDLAKTFYNRGGTNLFLDEVHKYPHWSQELKNLYDDFKDLQIVFTGSSIIEINKQQSDLSRRALYFELHGLSFREYLAIKQIMDKPALTLKQLLEDHQSIALEWVSDWKPLEHFNNYLRYGYYPVIMEDSASYYQRIEQIMNLIIENDLNFIEGYHIRNAIKIKQLLYILSVNVPFMPNIQKLAEKMGIARNTLMHYLFYLEKAKMVHSLYPTGKSISILQKPEKIYLHNTNLAYVLSPENINAGTLRETFFLNQVSAFHEVNAADRGDFMVDNHYIFEIGGKNKTNQQVQEIENAFVVKDDMVNGFGNKIPLWMFGFLY
jgi:predicted AAA+ superfamily ATPase